MGWLHESGLARFAEIPVCLLNTSKINSVRDYMTTGLARRTGTPAAQYRDPI